MHLLTRGTLRSGAATEHPRHRARAQPKRFGGNCADAACCEGVCVVERCVEQQCLQQDASCNGELSCCEGLVCSGEPNGTCVPIGDPMCGEPGDDCSRVDCCEGLACTGEPVTCSEMPQCSARGESCREQDCCEGLACTGEPATCAAQ